MVMEYIVTFLYDTKNMSQIFAVKREIAVSGDL